MKNELAIKKIPSNPFSIKARLKSFQFAFAGLNSFFSTQHNAIIHLIMTLLAFSAAVLYHVTKVEAIAITLSVGFVWTAELLNTAIEKLADLVSTDHHPAIKFIKDVSAAGVLLSALAAFITGAIIFLPKLLP
ncbi:MAG TPA: diacylglycerol kinase family protein [Chitinophagaceae bacterium]|jgi:diacylglycerol kinase (ATP)|nr:diacylglycerol kinase family protein [Chitinophagaceae bacterium]